MLLIGYRENNNGGYRRVTEDGWKTLEAAGWKRMVRWPKGDATGNYVLDENGLPVPNMDTDDWDPHMAFKICETPGHAIREWEVATGLQATDEGCTCCGVPHRFEWEGGSCGGQGCLQYLFPGKKIHRSLREALEDEENKDS